MRFNLKKSFLKYIVPSFVLILSSIGYTYVTTGYIAPFGSSHIELFSITLLSVAIFCGVLDYFQQVIDSLIPKTWLVIIFVVFIFFYVYRINGKI